MALPETPLSHVCEQLSAYLRGSDGLSAASNSIVISTGAPANIPDDHDNHRVNLFFYRFEPSAFDADVRPDQVWRLRVYCLITVIGIDEDGRLAGENELRLLGELLRLLRRRPVFDAGVVAGEQVQLQLLFNAIGEEQINQLWSTQGDTHYHPSLGYEMAVIPVVPAEAYVEPPLVGGLGSQAFSSQQQRFAAFSGRVQGPAVPFRQVDIDNPAWAAELCWVRGGQCALTLSLDVDSSEFAGFVPSVWVAGDPTDGVELLWEVWDAGAGWRRSGDPQTVTPFTTAIDPEHVPTAITSVFPIELSLPLTLPSGAFAIQLMLYARRRPVLVPGPGQSQPPLVRSNPLLISLYRSA